MSDQTGPEQDTISRLILISTPFVLDKLLLIMKDGLILIWKKLFSKLVIKLFNSVLKFEKLLHKRIKKG